MSSEDVFVITKGDIIVINREGMEEKFQVVATKEPLANERVLFAKNVMKQFPETLTIVCWKVLQEIENQKQ